MPRTLPSTANIGKTNLKYLQYLPNIYSSTQYNIYTVSTSYLLSRYRASCVRQLTYTYTCPATVLHALHVSGLAQCTGKTSLVRQYVTRHVCNV